MRHCYNQSLGDLTLRQFDLGFELLDLHLSVLPFFSKSEVEIGDGLQGSFQTGDSAFQIDLLFNQRFDFQREDGGIHSLSAPKFEYS